MPEGDEEGLEHVEADERDVDPRNLSLDPQNPRLHEDEAGSSQSDLIRVMIERFRIGEIAESILASGFLPFDPIVVYEDDSMGLVVAEGNRRVAALQLLLEPDRAPERYQEEWEEYSNQLPESEQNRIESITVFVVPDRDHPDVDSYLGFRHVTGIMNWPPLEKAGFIADLIRERGWEYDDVAERLGHYPSTIEKFYVAHRLAKQARDLGIPGADRLEESFGFLRRALQSSGTRDFLGVEYPRDSDASETPVPDEKTDELREFIEWTFGTDEREPLFTDSRKLTKWGRILENDDAVAYLRRNENPKFRVAFRKSGGEAESLAETLRTAADHLEESVAIVPTHEDDEDVRSAVQECTRFFVLVIQSFPEVWERHKDRLPAEFLEGGDEDS